MANSTGAHPTAQQAQGLQAYLREQSTHPRYRWLERSYQLASPEAFSPDRKENYNRAVPEPATRRCC